MFEILTAPRRYGIPMENVLKESTDPQRELYGPEITTDYTWNGHRFTYGRDHRRYILQGDQRYVRTEAPTHALLSGGQWYQWKNEEGYANSPRFYAIAVPKQVAAADVDHDGDEDLVIEYGNGDTQISYNLCVQFLSGQMYVGRSTDVRSDIKAWMEDHFAKLVQLHGYEALEELFAMRALPQQAWDELQTAFEDTTRPADEKADALQQIVAKFADRYGDLYSYDPKALREKSALALLDRDFERWKSDHYQAAFGLHYLGADVSLAHIDRDLESAWRFIAVMREQTPAVMARGVKIAEHIGRNDGGIGIVFDPQSELRGFVKITDVLPGTPAHKVQLKSGDRILAVDGVSIEARRQQEAGRSALLARVQPLAKELGLDAKPQSVALKAISGPFKSPVVLTIRRGEETFDVSLTRDVNLAPLAFVRGN